MSEALSVDCYRNSSAQAAASASVEFFTIISLVPGSQGSDICY